MKVLSFVKSIEDIKRSALVYIRETIKREGEITLPTNDDEEGFIENGLRVPCYDSFTGDIGNYDVKTIKADAIIGIDEWGAEREILSDEWCDGTAEWIADYVAEYYGELNNE